MRRLPRSLWLPILTAAVAVMLQPAPGLADNSTLITFEETPVSSPPPKLGVRYGNRGVLLSDTAELMALPAASLASRPHSGTYVLVSDDIGKEADPEPLIIEFTQLIRSARLYTGVPWDTAGVSVLLTLTAYDAGGTIVDRTSWQGTGPTDIDRRLDVAAPGTQDIIAKIVLDAQQAGRVGTYEYVDDLTIVSESPPPVLATEPPKVVVKTPPNGSTSSDGKVVIGGDITGDGLFFMNAPPELQVSHPSQLYGGKLTTTSDFAPGTDLFQFSPTHFAFVRPDELEAFGQNTITVIASNPAGTGSAQTMVTYLPKKIADAFSEAGGAATFGAFTWGKESGNCAFAVYDKGAIFLRPWGTFTATGPVFAKWDALAAPEDLGVLGCASSAQVGAAQGVWQDFDDGRIYAGTTGTYHVIEPFRDAIDRLDFDDRYGWPVSSPISQSSQLLPLLWQKFARTIGGKTFVSTMEITDKPLTLWTATPDLDGADRAQITKPTERLPTLWRSFPCATLGKPCIGVSKPKPLLQSPYSILSNACNGGSYPFSSGVAQWEPLASGLAITPYLSTVTGSGLSGIDAVWNHSCSTWKDGEAGFKGVDWNISTAPFPGYEPLLGGRGETVVKKRLIYPNLVQDHMEIEYEYCLVGFPPEKAQDEYLRPGDQLFVAGRWISDCGCHPFSLLPTQACTAPYRAEIHPPGVMIDIYSGKALGKPATLGKLIYFDWWYPGETVDVAIHPPPRPSADAVLSAAIPVWPSYCPSDGGKCGIASDLAPPNAPNHIQLKISGRPDVPFHTPPKEDGNGQLFHGSAPPIDRQPVLTGEALEIKKHSRSLWGTVELRWIVPE